MATTYTRPSDWLTMPTVASSAQTFVGLFAVNNNDGNYVALLATTNTGTYQVDWGDGNVTTHNSNTQAEYKYTYSAISESTLSSGGYKQVLVRVTPVTGNILTFSLNRIHSALGVTTVKKTTWLEWLVNFPNLSSGTSFNPWLGNSPRHSWCEKVTINHIGGMTDMGSVFGSMTGLKQANITATTTGLTSTYNMFTGCHNLVSVNLFDTRNVTNATVMFQNCYNLEEVPNFNLSKVTQAVTMFQNCYKLKTAPAFDMRLNLDFSSMFSGCNNLTEIGLMDTRSGTNFSNFALSCNKLKTVANLDMSKATNCISAFGACTSLDNFPAITVGTANCNLTGFFNNNSMMKKVGNIDVSKAINFTTFFNGNQSLRTLPALNLNSGTTLTNMIGPVMTRAPFTNVRASLSLANKNLGRTAIVEVFNGLASGVTSKTITVSANPGYASLTAADRLIATAKGWTIA
jgi:surface protein